MMQSGPPVILASQSAARAAMLRAAGLVFEARPARIDEAAVKQSAQAERMSAAEAALLLAELKAARIRDPDALVIGADQILVCDDVWFDKPEDVAMAGAHLRQLRGRTHRLVTAVVCQRGGSTIWHHVETASLTMRPFSVGAYRLEGPGIQLFDRIDGAFHTILGLPLLALCGFLRQHQVVGS